MTQLRLYLILGLIGSVLAGGGYIWWLQGKAAQADALRTELRVERQRHAQQLEALAEERAAADRRDAIVTSGREAIIAAPAADDAPVASVLLRALRTADEIGGIK